MSVQEKRSIITLLTTLIVIPFYSWFMYHRYQGGGFFSEHEYSIWGAYVLFLIPVVIFVKIILHFVFKILHTIDAFDHIPTFTDERAILVDTLDRPIELKSTKNSQLVLILGFLLAMIPLAGGLSVHYTFMMLIASAFISEVVGLGSQLYLYRKGVLGEKVSD